MVDMLPITLAFFFLGIREAITEQSVLGFGLTYIVFTFGYSFSLPDLIGLKCSSLADKKNYGETTVMFGRVVLCTGVYVTSSFLISTFSGPILRASGIDYEFAVRVASFIKVMSIAKYLEILLYLGRGFLICQKITDVFWYLNMLSACSTIFFVYLFLYKLEMSEKGYALAMFCKVFLETSLCIYFVMTRSNKELLFVPSLSQASKDFGEMFQYSVHIMVGNYGEWMAVEINSYFSALTKKVVNIVTWTCTMNVCNIHYLTGMGEISFLRTYGSNLIGAKDREGFKKLWNFCFKWAVVNHSVIAILVFIYASSIAHFYTSDIEAHPLLTRLLRILPFIFPAEYLLVFINTSMRLIGRESQQFKIVTFLFPLVIISTSLVLSFGLGLENFGLLFAFFITVIICTVLQVKIFLESVDGYFDELEHGSFIDPGTPIFARKLSDNESRLNVQLQGNKQEFLLN